MYLNKLKKKKAENQCLLNKLTERLCHKYYGVKEKGGAGQAEKLEASLNPIIYDPNPFDKFFDAQLYCFVSIFNQ